MLDQNGSSLTQNRIHVRLIQANRNFYKPVWRSDLQLLHRPAGGTESSFDPKDFSAGASNHLAKLAHCLG